MKCGFLRVCSASPDVVVADCKSNAKSIIDCVKQACKVDAKLIVFPELSITSYSCEDLFLQTTLQKSAVNALINITEQTASCNCIIAIGLPFYYRGALYNCAAFVYEGKILALVPKTYIPNYSEFYELRYFSSAFKKNVKVDLDKDHLDIPFGTDIILDVKSKNYENFLLACEICEDLWAPLPPSTMHALAGATVIANLSASNEVIGKAEYRRNLVSSQSARTITCYVYSDAGHGESSQDVVFASHNIIAENGSILSEAQPFSQDENGCTLIYADVDLERIKQERQLSTTFSQCASQFDCEKKLENYAKIPVNFDEFKVVAPDYKNDSLKCDNLQNSDLQNTSDFIEAKKNCANNASNDQNACNFKLLRIIEKSPFVPTKQTERDKRCNDVINLQAEGLAKRLRHIGAKNAVIGLSGGLDSTLALLVTCKAFDLCKLDRKGIHSITLPCFGTTNKTYNNACTLAKECGTQLTEINIKQSVLQHFADIGHDPTIYNVTYENSQARERTQILMDIANEISGIVIGTGDLSELALGWATFNGDHISMYSVNSSIPKTLVRHLVEWFSKEAESTGKTKLSCVLKDILDTPISPELLPPKDEKIVQKTEDLVGPYELHDFFIYYVLRFGFSPTKIYYLAKNAFKDKYTSQTILKWLTTFYKRFFSQQFKRSCSPDGAKVGTVSLSPRGDWRMPSDASAKIWLDELKNLQKEITC